MIRATLLGLIFKSHLSPAETIDAILDELSNINVTLVPLKDKNYAVVDNHDVYVIADPGEGRASNYRILLDGPRRDAVLSVVKEATG